MPRARQGQIMAIGLALSIGLGLVLSYLLEWSIGVVFDTLSSRLSEISFPHGYLCQNPCQKQSVNT